VLMVTEQGFSCIQLSAIKLSSVPLASAFSVKRGGDGDDAGVTLLAPALTRFPKLLDGCRQLLQRLAARLESGLELLPVDRN
jgi:hypothetical protein